MQKDDQYVLFGASITGMAVLQYYGKNSIVAVIDNDMKKIGKLYEGIPIISFDTYLKEYQELTVIVSIYSRHYFDCITQLKRNGVNHYFTSPPIIYGLESPEDFAKNKGLTECEHIVFYGDNPITKRIENYIRKNSTVSIDYIDNRTHHAENKTDLQKIEMLSDKDTLVLTTNEIENPVRGVAKEKFTGKIIDLYDYQEERKKQYEYLEKYKNIYAGKRCFVVGNGPSLREEDLLILEKNREISFASNGIFHIYDKVSWRPTHYMLCDAFAYKTMYKDIVGFEDENAFIADFYYTDFGTLEKANRFYLINKLYDNDRFEFSSDAVKGLYSGKTITYVMIQMACYMVVKEIYLLGVDWTGGKGTGAKRIDFYEDSNENTGTGDKYDLFTEEKHAYETARDYAASHGIKIYNATRGGELEVFERVMFDRLFC